MDYTALKSQPACQAVSTAQQLWELEPIDGLFLRFVYFLCLSSGEDDLSAPTFTIPPPTAYCQWDPVKLCPDCTPPLLRTFHGSLSE